jgi:catechol 2,3-dioxygenase-like lactoylglutathione lyase family enzyme
MNVLRMDHVGVVFDDLDSAIAFFRDLGFEIEGPWFVDGETVDKINGLAGVRAEAAMARTPDRTGCLELIKYHAPATDETPSAQPANRLGLRHVCLEVDDIDPLVAGLRAKGFDTVGEVRDYEDFYRLCYLRGPEGLIIEFAQKLGS